MLFGHRSFLVLLLTRLEKIKINKKIISVIHSFFFCFSGQRRKSLWGVHLYNINRGKSVLILAISLRNGSRAVSSFGPSNRRAAFPPLPPPESVVGRILAGGVVVCQGRRGRPRDLLVRFGNAACTVVSAGRSFFCRSPPPPPPPLSCIVCRRLCSCSETRVQFIVVVFRFPLFFRPGLCSVTAHIGVSRVNIFFDFFFFFGERGWA